MFQKWQWACHIHASRSRGQAQQDRKKASPQCTTGETIDPMTELKGLTPDKCPKCGEPPREMQARINCLVPLERNEQGDWFPRYDRLRRVSGHYIDSDVVVLRCGGGHWWTGKRETNE